MLNIEVIKKGQKATYTPVYIGRPSVLGNPYPVSTKTVQEHNRVCALYRVWLWEEIKKGILSPVYLELLKILEMARNDGVSLVCWCKPLPCHGDVVKNALIYLDSIIPSIAQG
jgi:hypothetical protein